jgi:hypothetical protein
MVYVDLKSQLKLTNDKALYTMIESKVSMLVALEQAKTASTAAGLNASLVSADKAIVAEAKDAVLAISSNIKPRYFGGVIHAAHRGYAAHSIENTMTAFTKAIQYRADALELDVQISSDGVPVVIPTTPRLITAQPLVATSKILQRLNCGQWLVMRGMGPSTRNRISRRSRKWWRWLRRTKSRFGRK